MAELTTTTYLIRMVLSGDKVFSMQPAKYTDFEATAIECRAEYFYIDIPDDLLISERLAYIKAYNLIRPQVNT